MKDMNFKNFNYSFINSAKAGYKEVLVTYEANGKSARKILFVKEAKGKNASYYVNEAKKQIESQIKSGKLAKESSKQIKHAGSKGILKPFMVTLSCVLAAGAIGTGGYFTYKYFTSSGGGGGGGGGEEDTSFTVTLLPGEGSFKDDKPYLTYEKVEKGTELKSLAGYTYPTTADNKDFNFWTNDKGEQFVDTSTVESDLVLTASFYEGAGYYRAKTVKDIQIEIDALKEAGVSEARITAHENILKTTSEALEKENFLVSTDQIKALSNFANATLDETLSTDVALDSIVDLFNQKMELAYKIKPDKLLALLNAAASCEEAAIEHILDKASSSYFDLFRELVKYIEGADESATRILNLTASSFMKATSRIINPASFASSQRFANLVGEGVNFIENHENLTDDQIKELGDFISDYIVAIANCSNMEPLVVQFYKSALQSYEEALNATEDKELRTAIYKLNFGGMKSLSNLGNGNEEFAYDVELALRLIDHIKIQFNTLYQKMAITVDNIQVATEFALIACDAAKNIRSADEKEFTDAFDALIGDYLNSQNSHRDITLKTMEGFAHFPKVFLQTPAIEMATKLGVDFKSFTTNLRTVYNTMKSNIDSAQGDISKEIMKAVELGRLESSAYSPFCNIVLSNKTILQTLKSHYDNVIKMCQDGKAVENDKIYEAILPGFFIGLGEVFQYFCLPNAQLNQISNLNEGISQHISAIYNGCTGELRDIFMEHFAPVMSIMPSLFRSYFDDTSSKFQERMYQEMSMVSYSFSQHGDAQSLNNFFKIYEKLYSSERIFKINSPSLSLTNVIKNEKDRIEYVLYQGYITQVFDIYPSIKRFDSIYETFEKEFFSKICYNMDKETVLKLLDRAKALVA